MGWLRDLLVGVGIHDGDLPRRDVAEARPTAHEREREQLLMFVTQNVSTAIMAAGGLHFPSDEDVRMLVRLGRIAIEEIRNPTDPEKVEEDWEARANSLRSAARTERGPVDEMFGPEER